MDHLARLSQEQLCSVLKDHIQLADVAHALPHSNVDGKEFVDIVTSDVDDQRFADVLGVLPRLARARLKTRVQSWLEDEAARASEVLMLLTGEKAFGDEDVDVDDSLINGDGSLLIIEGNVYGTTNSDDTAAAAAPTSDSSPAAGERKVDTLGYARPQRRRRHNSPDSNPPDSNVLDRANHGHGHSDDNTPVPAPRKAYNLVNLVATDSAGPDRTFVAAPPSIANIQARLGNMDGYEEVSGDDVSDSEDDSEGDHAYEEPLWGGVVTRVTRTGSDGYEEPVRDDEDGFDGDGGTGAYEEPMLGPDADEPEYDEPVDLRGIGLMTNGSQGHAKEPVYDMAMANGANGARGMSRMSGANDGTNPFLDVMGAPKPLTPEEYRALKRQNSTGYADPIPRDQRRGVSADGDGYDNMKDPSGPSREAVPAGADSDIGELTQLLQSLEDMSPGHSGCNSPRSQPSSKRTSPTTGRHAMAKQPLPQQQQQQQQQQQRRPRLATVSTGPVSGAAGPVRAQRLQQAVSTGEARDEFRPRAATHMGQTKPTQNLDPNSVRAQVREQLEPFLKSIAANEEVPTSGASVLLRKRKMTTRDASELAAELNSSLFVSILTIRQCPLDTYMVKLVFNAVADHPALTRVSADDCRIDNEGATKIAEGLRRNRVLKSLSLKGNKIGDVGAKALYEATHFVFGTPLHNTTLERVVLAGNPVGKKLRQKIMDSITDPRDCQFEF